MAIAGLSAELGYAVEAAEMAARLRRIRHRGGSRVVVATAGDAVVGWMQVQETESLEGGARVEIAGLVVAPACRRAGVGRKLVAEAERWARERGAPVLMVRSNVQREESHRFYPALGFALTKTQAVYRKKLAAS